MLLIIQVLQTKTQVKMDLCEYSHGKKTKNNVTVHVFVCSIGAEATRVTHGGAVESDRLAR